MIEPDQNDRATCFPTLDESGTVDISLVEAMLALTPGERLRRHAALLDLAYEAREIRKKKHGFDPWEVSVPEETD